MDLKTPKLNELFQKWRQSYGDNAKDFADYGIIQEDLWMKAKRKVLFLMKETNFFAGDLRKLARDNPWKVVGYWAYGLQNVTVEQIPPFVEAKREENYKNAYSSAAIMNLKKMQGGPAADMIKVNDAVKRDAEFIKTELEIIRPEIVICCGTFGIVGNIISDFEKLVPEDRSYRHINAVWIDYCHPSARYYYHRMMYYGLSAIYQNCLRQKADSS